jgi:hypothetical protein
VSAIVNSHVFGQFTRALSAAQLETVAAYEKGLGYIPLRQALQFPCGIFPWVVTLGADPDNNTIESLPYKVPFPVKLWAVDMGCTSAAGSAATGDITRDATPAGGGFVSVFTAAKDIKTAPNVVGRYTPEAGQEVWAFGDEFKFVVIGTGAGAVVGARAVLWLQQL